MGDQPSYENQNQSQDDTAAPAAGSVDAVENADPVMPQIVPATPATAWIAGFTPRHLLGALAHVGVAIGAAFIGAILLTVLLAVSGDTAMSATPLGDIGDIPFAGGAIAGMLISLTAFVYGGELGVSFGGNGGFLSAAGSASIWLFPLTITVAALVAVLWWGVRQERMNPLPTRLHRGALAAATGAVTGVLLLFFTLIFVLRVEEGPVNLQISAAGYRVVLFSILLVGGVAYLGRWVGTRAEPREIWRVSAARAFRTLPLLARESLTYAAMGAALFGVLGTIFLIVAGWERTGPVIIGLALVGLLNSAPLVAAIGHLGGVSAGGSFGGAKTDSTVTVFNGGEPILWLVVLLTVLFSVFVALWIGTRRARTAAIDWRSSWRLPVVVFAAWLVFGTVFVGIGFGAQGAAGVFGGSVGGGIGVALWSPFVFLVWAFAVELGAQALPRVAYAVAPQLHRALVGRVAFARWVAGAGESAEQGAQQHPDDPGAAAPLTAPRPLSPGAKRGLLIGLISAGSLIALAIVGSIGVAVLNSTRTPEAVVQQYLDHLAAGRAEAAGALADPNVPTAGRAFLTDEVLASASARITDVRVEDDSTDGDAGYVAVSYRLDGVHHKASLAVAKGEPELLVLDTWHIQDTLARTVPITARGQGTASIGRTPIPLEFDGAYGQAEVVLYPGVYEVGSDDSGFFALEDATLTVSEMFGSGELIFAPTEALTRAVEKQVDEMLSNCVASTDAHPDGCPFDAFTWNDETKVVWTLQGEPTISIDETGTRATVEGTAIATYSEEMFSTTRERADEDRYSMYGNISIDGDEAEVDFDDNWW